MPLYTFGGTPSDVLTDEAGNVIPDYPLLIRVAGTGATVTALYEEDGTTPIGTLRSDPADSATPGRVRVFKALDVSEIEYEYLDASGQPVRWYQAGREIAAGALQTAQQALADAGTKLDRETTSDQDVAGPVTFQSPVTFEDNIAAPNLPDLPGARWFVVTGAVGNGSTDDRAVIQAQLDAAYAAGGGTVFLPAGRTYGISTFLVIRDNTTLWAYGATLKSIGNSGLMRNFLASETFGGYSGHSHIQILGGVWDGNAADAGVGTVTAETDIANFVHCSDILVKDATFRNCSTAHGLEFNSTDGGRAINCKFEGFKDNSSGGTRGFSEAIQVDMAKSGSSSIGSFDNTASKNIRIEGCTFGPSARLGAYGRAVGSHTLAAGVVYDNIKVLDCDIDVASEDAIYAYGWSRSLIRGNTIRNTGKSSIRYAIPDPATMAIAPFGITIRDNYCEGAGDDSGIRVTGYAGYKIPLVSIHGNTVKSITGNAIHAEHCLAPSIGKNTTDGTSSTGLYALYSDGANLSGNTVRNAGSNAVNISGSVGATVQANTVDTTSSNFGIFVGQGVDGSTNSRDALIVGNQISAPASSGIRLSTNATGCLVVGNKVRKDGGAATSALSMAASATGCTVLSNDFGGNGWNAAAAMSVSTAAPVTGPGGMTSLPGSNIVDGDLTPVPALEAAMSPAGRYETTSRLRCGTESSPSSGWLYLCPIWLPKGLVVSTISFTSGNTAAGTPTNYWFTLHNSSRVALARTADQTTAAWAANTTKSLTIAQTTAGAATSYTTTYAGLHYLGFMVAATNPPSIIGEGRLITGGTASPGLGATSSGLTTPPTVTSGAYTAAAFAGSAILAYGYVS